LKEVLEKKTEKSAILLREYLGEVTLDPTKPDIGKPYYQARSKVTTVPLLKGAAKGSNSLQWWTLPGSNR
ncbi:MAG: hypothetical protein KDD70_19235, partial [Bdellovibrionales bacterium]|nr:hypothetical protein [Bdellovibrionales bacterium]